MLQYGIIILALLALSPAGILFMRIMLAPVSGRPMPETRRKGTAEEQVRILSDTAKTHMTRLNDRILELEQSLDAAQYEARLIAEENEALKAHIRAMDAGGRGARADHGWDEDLGAGAEEADVSGASWEATDPDLSELGLGNAASNEDIKSAWRAAVKTHHPDRGGDEEVFKRVNGAYERLRARRGF